VITRFTRSEGGMSVGCIACGYRGARPVWGRPGRRYRYWDGLARSFKNKGTLVQWLFNPRFGRQAVPSCGTSPSTSSHTRTSFLFGFLCSDGITPSRRRTRSPFLGVTQRLAQAYPTFFSSPPPLSSMAKTHCAMSDAANSPPLPPIPTHWPNTSPSPKPYAVSHPNRSQ